jgi:hypothetical protein
MLDNEGIKDIITNTEENQKKQEDKESKYLIEMQKKLESIPVHIPVHIPVNTNPVNEIKDKIIVKFKNDIFTIYDYKNSILGTFTPKELIKCLCSCLDLQNINFLQGVDITDAQDIVNKLIGNITKQDNNKYNVILRSYMDSPIMGNIEVLLNLNNCLYNYEKNKLDNDMINIQSQKIKNNIRKIVTKFNYAMLHHTLKIISLISEQIKNDPTKKDLANSLLKHSIQINSRISNYVKTYLDFNIEQMNSLLENNHKIKTIRKILTKKLNNMNNIVNNQQNEINVLLKSFNNKSGGNYSNSQSYLSSNNISTSITPTNLNFSSNNNLETSSIKQKNKKKTNTSDSAHEMYHISDSSILNNSYSESNNNFNSDESEESSNNTAYDSLTTEQKSS